jgi:hypothetical protein
MLDRRFLGYLDVPDLTIGLVQSIGVINFMIQTTHVTIHGFVVYWLSAVCSTIHTNIDGFPTSIVQLRNAVHIVFVNRFCSIVRALSVSLSVYGAFISYLVVGLVKLGHNSLSILGSSLALWDPVLLFARDRLRLD